MQGTAKTVILVGAALLGIQSNQVAGGEPLSRFKMTTKRDSDKVEIAIDKDKTVLSITSPFGISDAKIERLEEKWPDAVMLRLHLKGLESFKVSNDKVVIHAAVSSSGDKLDSRQWKDDKEDSLLDSKNPYWLEIQIIGADGKPAKSIPLKEGYFELQLPNALFEGNPKSITLNWIDFYRN